MLAVYGMYVLFKILKFPDISADNVFAFGSIAGAFYLINTENVYVAIGITMLSGFVIGNFTSILYSLIKIPKLLAGIITYSILFSINLKFFQKPNVSLNEELYNNTAIIYTISALDIVAIVFIIYLFKTKLGKTLITAGSNSSLLKEFEASYPLILLIGLGLCSAFIALSGFLTSLYFGFSDVNIGVGTLINSVAAIMISEKLITFFNKNLRFLIIFLGILSYNFILYFIITYLLFDFLDYSDYKLISGLIIILFFIFNRKSLEDLISF